MTKQTLIILAYDAERDLKALSQIWFDASLKAHAFLGEEKILQQRGLIETVYLPNAETFVAVGDAGPIGFISLLDSFIGGLFIAPDAQGQGAGAALIEHARRLKGALSVGVYIDNHRAHKFYKKLGFIDGELQEKDDEGLPFAVMKMHMKS